MALFPTFDTPPAPEPLSRVLCRPPPVGGCISFLKYWHHTSNRFREYGPFDRFIDRAKLVTALTFNDIVADDRYAVALKVPLLGVVETPRFDFQDEVFPFHGLECPTTA
jgi:hypothetical protein